MINLAHPTNGLSLGAMTRAAMATTSIASHEARIAHQQRHDDPRMHMTIDELRALPGGHLDGDVEPDYKAGAEGALERRNAKAARRAARLGNVPVVINRKPPAPVKPKRKSRAKVKNAA